MSSTEALQVFIIPSMGIEAIIGSVRLIHIKSGGKPLDGKEALEYNGIRSNSGESEGHYADRKTKVRVLY